MMGGVIGVESQPGKGSTFWVQVKLGDIIKHQPLLADPKITPPDKIEKKPSSGKTILYIGDSPANLKIVKTLIESHTSHALISVLDASLGLTLAEDQKPDLIMMDINLSGMNGYQAKAQLQKNKATQHIPVVAISASAMPKDIEKCKSAGFRDYITKPINVKVVLNIVEKILS